jgi:hypothetical protein
MTELSSAIKFADPIRSDDLGECQFYHKMVVPGHGEVGGQWDLRPCINEYLGNYDFAGKRALDVGTAAGFLTFEMERQGADVVSFDMESGAKWDVVPQKKVRADMEAHMRMLMDSDRKLKNAYWFTHARLKSRARAFYGDIYALPKELGHFDVAVMAMIISHLREPFQAIYGVSQLCDTLIITNPVYPGKDAVACFVPTTENAMDRVWWIPTEKCLRQMLKVIGFEVIRQVESKPICHAYGGSTEERCTAFVSERRE